MIKFFLLLNLFLVFSTFNSCDKPPFAEDFYSILVNNKSTIDVGVMFSSIEYPDTSLPLLKPELTKISSKQGYEFTSMMKWYDRFKTLKKDTLSIYFFSTDTLSKYPWDSIRLNYKILQRYDLSLKDLENRNFEIEYPYNSTKGKLKVYTM